MISDGVFFFEQDKLQSQDVLKNIYGVNLDEPVSGYARDIFIPTC